MAKNPDKELMRLLGEIDSEIRGKNRPMRLLNLTRMSRLVIIKKARNHERV